MREPEKIIGSVVLIAAAFFALTFSCSKPSNHTGPLPGMTAPDFRAEDLSGRTVFLNAELHRPIVLTFFATWCDPCKAEAPLLIEVREKFGDAIEVLCIVTDPENKDKVVLLNKALSIPYPMLMDRDGAIMKSYGVSTLPFTMLIDAKGKVRTVFAGFGLQEQKSLVNTIEQLIGKR